MARRRLLTLGSEPSLGGPHPTGRRETPCRRKVNVGPEPRLLAVDRRHVRVQSEACLLERRLHCCLMFPLSTLAHSGKETRRLGEPWRPRLDAPSKISAFLSS